MLRVSGPHGLPSVVRMTRTALAPSASSARSGVPLTGTGVNPKGAKSESLSATRMCWRHNEQSSASELPTLRASSSIETSAGLSLSAHSICTIPSSSYLVVASQSPWFATLAHEPDCSV